MTYCTKEDLESVLSQYFGPFMKKLDVLNEAVEALGCEQQNLRTCVEALSAAMTTRADNTDRRVNDLVQRADAVETSIRKLETQLAEHPQISLSPEHILCELEDRCKRATNVIMFDVPEASDQGRQHVATILEPLAISSNPVHCARIGASASHCKSGHLAGAIRERPRPLVITFKSRYDALLVLKNRDKLKLGGRLIQAKSDQTVMQREQLVAARADLEDRRQRGETHWTIKFQRGVPRVVEIGVSAA